MRRLSMFGIWLNCVCFFLLNGLIFVLVFIIFLLFDFDIHTQYCNLQYTRFLYFVVWVWQKAINVSSYSFCLFIFCFWIRSAHFYLLCTNWIKNKLFGDDHQSKIKTIIISNSYTDDSKSQTNKQKKFDS